MTVGNVVSWFFRSPVGIAGSAASVLAAALVFGSGFGVFSAIALGFTVLALTFFSSLSTRNGLKSLIRRKDLDETFPIRERLAEASKARTGMASLRLPDPGISAARDRLVLEAGKFLEDSAKRLESLDSNDRLKTGKGRSGEISDAECDRLPLYDPAAIEAIIDARTLLDAVLHELDETASERRFGAGDAHPVDDPVGRAILVLSEKTRDILSGRDRIRGTPDLSIRLEIEEELK